MARKVLTILDLQWNQLEKLKLENVTSTTTEAAHIGNVVGGIAYFQNNPNVANSVGKIKYKDNIGYKTVATEEWINAKFPSVTAATKCKITYNSNGLVTAGADLDAGDIPDLDASKITSGTISDGLLSNTVVTGAANGTTAKAWVDLHGNNVLKGVVVGWDGTGNLEAIASDKSMAGSWYFNGYYVESGTLYATYRTSAPLPSKNTRIYKVSNFDVNTGVSGNRPPVSKQNLEIEGNVISCDGCLYQYKNGAWQLVYQGAKTTDISSLSSRISTIETYFAAANSDNTLENWQELVRFLDSYSGTTNISDIFVAKNAAITANTSDLVFAKWDTKGLVTGAGSTAYKTTTTINGTSYSNILRTENANLPSFYAPTTAGNAGETLVSNGTANAPTWEKRAKRKEYTKVFALNNTGTTWTVNLLSDGFERSVVTTLYEQIGSVATDASLEEVMADIKITYKHDGSGNYLSNELVVTFAQAPKNKTYVLAVVG